MTRPPLLTSITPLPPTPTNPLTTWPSHLILPPSCPSLQPSPPSGLLLLILPLPWTRPATLVGLHPFARLLLNAFHHSSPHLGNAVTDQNVATVTSCRHPVAGNANRSHATACPCKATAADTMSMVKSAHNVSCPHQQSSVQKAVVHAIIATPTIPLSASISNTAGLIISIFGNTLRPINSTAARNNAMLMTHSLNLRPITARTLTMSLPQTSHHSNVIPSASPLLHPGHHHRHFLPLHQPPMSIRFAIRLI